jgi:hypothetical protein
MAMYSNLKTEFHQSNHILIGKDKLRIFDLIDDFVVIKKTNVEYWHNKYVTTRTPIHITDLQREIRLFSKRTKSKITLDYIYKGTTFSTQDAINDQVLMKPKSYLYQKFIGIHDYRTEMNPKCDWM